MARKGEKSEQEQEEEERSGPGQDLQDPCVCAVALFGRILSSFAYNLRATDRNRNTN